MISTMDNKIALELAEILKPNSNVHAMWIGGSVAEGYSDELSDIDLYIDIDDDQDKAVFAIVEQFLLAKGELDVKFTEGVTPPYSHCVYHLSGMNPQHFIEVTLHSHSNEFGLFDKLRKINVLFDKDGTTAFEPLDKAEYESMLKERKAFLVGKIEFGELSVRKEIQRQQFPDAMHNYVFWLVEPIIELARIKHSPLKITYNLKHASRDLPKETVSEIGSLYTIASLDDLNSKIEDVKAMLNKYR
jgi:predicted nucleotidyltransferase